MAKHKVTSLGPPCDLCGNVTSVNGRPSFCCPAGLAIREAATPAPAPKVTVAPTPPVEARPFLSEVDALREENTRLRAALEAYRDYSLVGRGKVAALALAQ